MDESGRLKGWVGMILRIRTGGPKGLAKAKMKAGPINLKKIWSKSKYNVDYQG
jgi:hypothetical protein